MKGKITNDGHLHIWRGDAYKQQHCAYKEDWICGDMCPLFKEPATDIPSFPKSTLLGMCSGVLIHFDEFEDERGKL